MHVIMQPFIYCLLIIVYSFIHLFIYSRYCSSMIDREDPWSYTFAIRKCHHHISLPPHTAKVHQHRSSSFLGYGSVRFCLMVSGQVQTIRRSCLPLPLTRRRTNVRPIHHRTHVGFIPPWNIRPAYDAIVLVTPSIYIQLISP